MTSPLESDVDTSTARLRRGEHASRDQTRQLVDGVLAGSVDLDAFGHWLVALADLGESADEIAGVAAALRGADAACRARPADRGRYLRHRR